MIHNFGLHLPDSQSIEKTEVNLAKEKVALGQGFSFAPKKHPPIGFSVVFFQGLSPTFSISDQEMFSNATQTLFLKRDMW